MSSLKRKIEALIFIVNTLISNLLGFVKSVNAVIIERELSKIVDENSWSIFAHLMIDHGRKVWIANRPQCSSCVLSDLCPSSL